MEERQKEKTDNMRVLYNLANGMIWCLENDDVGSLNNLGKEFLQRVKKTFGPHNIVGEAAEFYELWQSCTYPPRLTTIPTAWREHARKARNTLNDMFEGMSYVHSQQ